MSKLGNAVLPGCDTRYSFGLGNSDPCVVWVEMLIHGASRYQKHARLDDCLDEALLCVATDVQMLCNVLTHRASV